MTKFPEQKLAGKLNDIEEITNRAEKKFQLSKKLKVMKDEMKEFKLTTVPYKEVTFVLKAYDEVNARLDDQMVQTQAMLGSSNCVLKLRTDTRNWENKLTLMQDIIIEINRCQKQWMYLESIFSAADIQRQLPNESKAFFAVDKQFKDIMRRTKDRGNALQAGSTPGWLELFQKSNETLEKVQKNLEDYLETKRKY